MKNNNLILTVITILAINICSGQNNTVNRQAEFDSNPSGISGITSISDKKCNNCSGQETQIIANIPEPGDTMKVTVFTDYMTKRNTSEPIIGAKVYYETKNIKDSKSTYIFRTGLIADNTPSGVYDFVEVTNLPKSYSIEFISGHLENEHAEDGDGNGIKDDLCPNIPEYLYEIQLSSNSEIFQGKGATIGYLSTEGNCWCAQGTVAVTYRITNTE